MNDNRINITIKLNGEEIVFPKQQPGLINGTSVAPISVIFEKLGYSVEWEPRTMRLLEDTYLPIGKLTMTKGDTILEIVEAAESYKLNGEKFEYPIGHTAKQIGNTIMVPIRNILESVGCLVGWDGTTRTVDISTEPIGYFKIKNSAGNFLTYVGKSNNPITIEADNDLATQIWKIERSTEANKYHIRPAKYSTLAMNVYRTGAYPCSIQPTAGNISDTSFTIEDKGNYSYTIKWQDYGNTNTDHYLAEGNGSIGEVGKAYWISNSQQEWIFETVDYIPSAPSSYICYGNKSDAAGIEWTECKRSDERSLNDLVFDDYSVHEDVYGTSFLNAIFDHGCVITCLAMLLRNKNLVTSGKYDYRKDSYNNNLEADPYSVGMANMFKDDYDKWNSTSNNTIEDTYCNGSKPFWVKYQHITAAFGASVNYDGTLPENINTEADIAQYIHEKLQQHPEGIMIGFEYPINATENSTHSIIVTNSTYSTDSTNIDECFMFCDPVKGKETSLTDTWIGDPDGHNKHIRDVKRVGWIYL